MDHELARRVDALRRPLALAAADKFAGLRKIAGLGHALRAACDAVIAKLDSQPLVEWRVVLGTWEQLAQDQQEVEIARGMRLLARMPRAAAPPPPVVTDDPLAAPTHTLPGIGPAFAQALAERGLETVEDLIWMVPRRYDDVRDAVALADVAALEEGHRATFAATVATSRMVFARGRRWAEVRLGAVAGRSSAAAGSTPEGECGRIDEQGATARLRDRGAFGAKQLAAELFVAMRRGVDRDERLATPWAAIVDRARDDHPPRAVLAVDPHGCLGARDDPDTPRQLADLRAIAGKQGLVRDDLGRLAEPRAVEHGRDVIDRGEQAGQLDRAIELRHDVGMTHPVGADQDERDPRGVPREPRDQLGPRDRLGVANDQIRRAQAVERMIALRRREVDQTDLVAALGERVADPMGNSRWLEK